MKKEKYVRYFDRMDIGAVTVCYLYDGTTAVRGISVWNKKEDEYNEQLGEFHAKCNAERVLKGRRVDPIAQIEPIKTLIECDCPFTKRAEVLTKDNLSFGEAKFLFGNKKYMDFYKKFENKSIYSGMLTTTDFGGFPTCQIC